MSKRLDFQSNFTSGELSPRLYGQVDVAKYKNGLKTATNFRVLPHGPMVRRNGSQYIAEVKSSSLTTILIPFQFSTTAAYILEFGNTYIRFYKNGGQILSGGLPYEIVTPFLTAELEGIQYVQFGNTLYLSHPNHPPQQLVWTSDTSWAISSINFNPPALYQSGFAPVATCTPGATSGLGVTFTAGSGVFLPADVGREIHSLVDGGVASIVSYTDSSHVKCNIITNFASTSAIPSQSWFMDLSPISNLTPSGISSGSTIELKSISTQSGHFKPGGTLTVGALTGTGINFTASNAGTFNSGMVGNLIASLADSGVAYIHTFTSDTVVVVDIITPFQSTNPYASGAWEIQTLISTFRSEDVGRYITLNNGIMQITGIGSTVANNAGVTSLASSPAFVQATVLQGLNSLTETESWQNSTPVWTASNGYPQAIALHQQRLGFASTTLKPESVWLSPSGLYTSLGTGSGDSDGIEVDIASAQVNNISWMIGLRGDLLIGTIGGEVSLSGGNVDAELTPSTLLQSSRTANGGLAQVPIHINNEILYSQRSGRRVNAMRFNFVIDNYESEDLIFLSEHLTSSGIRKLIYANDPDRNIYAVMNDGTMAVGTYYKEQNVIAWTPYTTQGNYESVATIQTGFYNEIWVIVNRTINGSTKRYIERFDYTDPTSTNQSLSSFYTNLSGFSDCYSTFSDSLSIGSVTLANPGVFTVTAHGYSNGDSVKFFNMIDSGSSTSFTTIEGITYTVANKTTNTFQIKDRNGNLVDTTHFNTLSSGQVNKLVTVISGLDFLDGMTVQVKADGSSVADKVVSSGSITLDAPAYAVTVGLSYTSTANTLNLEYNTGFGSQQGQQARWVRPIIRLYKSCLPLVNGDLSPARIPPDLMDDAVPLFSGDIYYHGFTWQQNLTIGIETSLPLPLMVLGIFGSFDSGMQ